MSIQEEKLQAIADAIREKDGTTEPIPAKDFAERIRAIPSGKPPGRLPTGYIECEYMALDAATKVSTGLNMYTAYTRIIMDIAPKWHTSTAKCLFYAVAASGSTNVIGLARVSETSMTCQFGYATVGRSSITLKNPLTSGERFVIDVDAPNKTVTINEDSYSISPYLTANYNAANTLIGGLPTNSSYQTLTMDVYSFKLYRSGVLIGDFIPCIDPERVAGFYNIADTEIVPDDARFISAEAGTITPGPTV